jgi:hypothetical protein
VDQPLQGVIAIAIEIVARVLGLDLQIRAVIAQRGGEKTGDGLALKIIGA